MAPPIAHIVLALVLYVFITTAQIRQVKPGQCPRVGSRCSPRFQRNGCEMDDDCSGRKKCCNVCGRKCVVPTKVTTLKVKLASCPMELDFPSCDTEKPRMECETDGNCLGGLKCCQSGCGTRCVLALQDKRGSCPSYNTSACALQAPPSPDECHQDLQCPGSERCCCNDCVCKCTATERDGFCPLSASCVTTPDRTLCIRDTDCPPRQKCCLSMNRMECMAPMAGIPVDVVDEVAV